MVNAHGNLGDVVEVVELPEGAQGVQHHLGIFLRVHQDALPILEIDDVQELVRHDQAVAGAEPVRHITGEVQPLFDEDEGSAQNAFASSSCSSTNSIYPSV